MTLTKPHAPTVRTNSSPTGWLGLWIECACGWQSPGRHTRAAADRDFNLHVLGGAR